MNLTYTPERDRQTQATRDRLWKVIAPRWPTSADGQWYWKSDTSSDELDGHYFFYALYYDLVAKSDAEKQAVRAHVAGVADLELVGGTAGFSMVISVSVACSTVNSPSSGESPGMPAR